MTRAHTSDRTGEGAVYETEAAAVNVRPRRAEGGRSLLEYAVETDHPAPVRVRVRQPMPESAGIDDLGFPGECAEDWERDGDALLFERDVAPGATVRTAWGIDGELGEDLEPPTIEAEPVSIELDDEFEIDEGVLEGVDGDETADEGGAVLDLDDPDAESGGDGASPAAASESEDASSVLESPPELDDLETAPEDETFSIPETGEERTGEGTTADGSATDEPDAADAESVPGEAEDVDEESAETPSDADAEGTATDGQSNHEDGGAAADSVVRQLVAELHGEALDDEHRAALADALEVRLSDSTNAFVEHVRERQRRRAERIEDEIEALEESLDGLYGLKADASEVATLKRAITRLDDAKATDDDLRELRERVQDLAEASVDQAEVDGLREDHDSLAASLEATEEELATVEDEARSDREAISERVETAIEDLESLEERAATEERVETVADDLATLRDAAATEAALDDLEECLAELEDDAATEADFADLEEELESVEAQLEERIDLLADRHDELAAESATDAALESLRSDHRDRLNETASDLQALRDTLEDEYNSEAELQTALDRRVHRSLAHLVAFAVGGAGLVSTVPLAVVGSPAAAVTFLGGAGTLGLWWRSVGPAGLDGDEEASLRDRLP